ncbi:sugar ABC transporter substrate-binding protein [Streptomyces canus]|uniref:sugar ABC transporter substrate-binding protein n=1 Tax=Streptomyces TaxID=1883 RepID=UPI00099F8A42|nr:substrate-binding domain-containing protein [Streptomyces sp. LUP47B]
MTRFRRISPVTMARDSVNGREGHAPHRGGRRRTLAAILACGALTLAACGSSTADGAGDADESVSAGVRSAKATVERFSADQSAITLPALPAKPPSGLSLSVIGCPAPACQVTVKAVSEAARALDWKVRTTTSQFTPESYISSFNQALTDNPKLLTYIGVLPNSTVQAQLKAAKERGIKVVGISPVDAPGPLMPGAYAGASEYVAAGRLLANVVLADAGKPVGTLFVQDPIADGIFGPEVAMYKKTLTRLCPRCTTTDLKISTENVGRTVPSQIVSQLQRDSTIRYVVVPTDDFLPGVYAALQSAGLVDKVKLVGQTPNRQSLAALRGGQQFASVSVENSTTGWRAVDGLARLYMGVALGECCTAPAGWTQIFTKDNAPADDELSPHGTPRVPGDPDAFLKAWLVQ